MKYKTLPIVLIDDDEEDLMIVEEVLKSFNLQNEIHLFRDSSKVLEAIERFEGKIFFIICDINMPKIDGLSLRRKLNEIDTLRKKSVPFLFYSTSGEEHIVQQAYSLNIQGFFKKPTNISEYKLIFEDIMSYWTRSEIP